MPIRGVVIISADVCCTCGTTDVLSSVVGPFVVFAPPLTVLTAQLGPTPTHHHHHSACPSLLFLCESILVPALDACHLLSLLDWAPRWCRQSVANHLLIKPCVLSHVLTSRNLIHPRRVLCSVEAAITTHIHAQPGRHIGMASKRKNKVSERGTLVCLPPSESPSSLCSDQCVSGPSPPLPPHPWWTGLACDSTVTNHPRHARRPPSVALVSPTL